MNKNVSLKIQKWTTKDIVLNVTVYVLNALLIILMFIGMVYISSESRDSFIGYFTAFKSPLLFMVFLVLTVATMGIYFYFEERDFMKNAVNSEMLFLIIEVSFVVCYVFGEYVNVYLRPLTLVALLVTFLVGRKSAIFMNVIFCLIMFMSDTFSTTVAGIGEYSALIIGVSSGLVAVFVTSKTYSRLNLLTVSFFISVPVTLSVVFILMEKGWNNTVASLVSGVFSGPVSVAIFLVLLPVFEGLFKKVSSFKFAELTDHKARLIRRLIKEAPGTFNHSIVVSNIAEACATAIGEDALLARTCAYYHDIGKLRRPEFFSENQTDGVNPHNDLTPELSTNIIKAHANDGYSLVLKNRLPKEIADICQQHHGTLPILFFYDKAKKFTDGEVDISQFCYEGPKPQTKIAAIIMIADGCEAASRSLKDRSRSSVKKMVRSIVNDRMGLGQFDECEITIKELNIIIHTVVNNLTGIYHGRVEYPKVNLDGVDLTKDGEQ